MSGYLIPYAPNGISWTALAEIMGVPLASLLSANPGVVTPYSGFNINPPPPGGMSGSPMDTQGFGSPRLDAPHGEDNLPPPPPTLQTVPGIPNASSSGSSSSSGTSTSSHGGTGPVYSEAAIAGGAGPQPGGTVNGIYYPNLDPTWNLDSLLAPYPGNPNLNALSDPNAVVELTPGDAERLYSMGMSSADLQALGFVQQPDGSWRRGGSAPPQRNPGGWSQASDGSWHLNRNQAQIDKKKAAHQARKKSASPSQSTPIISWNI